MDDGRWESGMPLLDRQAVAGGGASGRPSRDPVEGDRRRSGKTTVSELTRRVV
jgi:hypothetical protein